MRISLLLLLILCPFACLSLIIGYTPMPLTTVLTVLLWPTDSVDSLIVWQLRLPRMLLGLMVGASLGLSGAALQGLLRNPLSEPGVIGVSTSAGLGAVIALYFGFSTVTPLLLPVFAMSGALLSTLLLVMLAARGADTITLLLCGIAISSLTVALTSLAMNLSPNPFALSEMVLWLLGSLRDRSFTDVWLAAPFMLFGWLLLLGSGRSLDALSIGEETAQSLGVPLLWLRIQVIGGVALATGASVASAGAIGFIGLVVPHLLRPLVQYQPGRLLLPSALGGALLLTMADILVRLPSAGPELMLGVVTALIGAPLFFYMILRYRHTWTVFN